MATASQRPCEASQLLGAGHGVLDMRIQCGRRGKTGGAVPGCEVATAEGRTPTRADTAARWAQCVSDYAADPNRKNT